MSVIYKLIPWYFWSIVGLVFAVFSPYYIIHNKKSSIEKTSKILFSVFCLYIGIYAFLQSIFIGFKNSDNVLIEVYWENSSAIDAFAVHTIMVMYLILGSHMCYKTYYSNKPKEEKRKKIALSLFCMFTAVIFFIVEMNI